MRSPVYKMGALKQGRGTCSAFKVFNITYLHVLLCRHGLNNFMVHAPTSRYVLGQNCIEQTPLKIQFYRGVCVIKHFWLVMKNMGLCLYMNAPLVKVVNVNCIFHLFLNLIQELFTQSPLCLFYKLLTIFCS